MSLITCPDCNKQVSNIAPYCPHCGRPIAAASPTPASREREHFSSEVNKTNAEKPYIKEQKGGGGCLTVFLILFGLGLLSSLMPDSARERAAHDSRSLTPITTPKGAFLSITVEKIEYLNGFFKVIGRVENTGETAAFSPTIVLKVYNSSGKILLAEDKTWPAGQLFNKMEPGTTAAFQHLVSVPGDSGEVSWQIVIPDYAFSAFYKNKLLSAGLGESMK